jgi:hypothetical protein
MYWTRKQKRRKRCRCNPLHSPSFGALKVGKEGVGMIVRFVKPLLTSHTSRSHLDRGDANANANANSNANANPMS